MLPARLFQRSVDARCAFGGTFVLLILGRNKALLQAYTPSFSCRSVARSGEATQ